jgi:phospholipid/cholesterol/gamma-HCH transport system permease protein
MDDGRGRPGAVTIDVAAGDGPGGRPVVRVAGELTLETTPPLWAAVPDVGIRGAGAARIDVAGVPRCDFAGASFLVALRRRVTGTDEPPAWAGASPQVTSLLELVEKAEMVPPATGAPPKDADEEIFEHVGRRTYGAYVAARDAFDYVGTFVLAMGRSLRAPRSIRARDVTTHMLRAGADALPIVALINFLMGIILAFQGVNLLGRLGFEVYVPATVAVGVLLELGPLMTAILVAGRSGSSFAAEIGTMRVNEEVDALDTMGLDRTRFLVVPKVLALLLMMPFLVVFGDACGLLGGLAIGVTQIDFTIHQYLQKSFQYVDLWGATQGMIKGQCYALDIAAVGCYRGLQTKQGAQAVGASATSAVVTSILLIIVTDAVLTVIFTYVHP